MINLSGYWLRINTDCIYTYSWSNESERKTAAVEISATCVFSFCLNKGTRRVHLGHFLRNVAKVINKNIFFYFILVDAELKRATATKSARPPQPNLPTGLKVSGKKLGLIHLLSFLSSSAVGRHSSQQCCEPSSPFKSLFDKLSVKSSPRCLRVGGESNNSEARGLL